MSSSKKSSYDAFSSVDKLVAKQVVGSDGAASWQDFQKTSVKTSISSVAPSIPLKRVDRLAGVTSMQDERATENEIRKQAGEAAVGEGYTVFKKKNTAEQAMERKKRKRIEQRLRPDDKKYFLPCGEFEGWKFDYVYTTRDRGTGYYWDGSDSLKRLKGETLPEEEVEETVDTEKDTEKPKKKKKKTKKANNTDASGPVILEDPNNPLEQVAQIIQRRNEAMNTPLPTVLKLGLPEGWDVATDVSTKKTYYYCRATGQRQWERPTAATTTTTVDSTSTSSSLPPGWSVAKDSKSGKEYFYHTTSGETRWERPT